MKKLPLLFFLVLSAAYLASCQNSKGQAGRISAVSVSTAAVNEVLTPTAYQQKLAGTPDVQLLDVRTLKEFQQGYIDGAVNIDFLNQEVFESEIVKLDRDRPVMLYCRSGRRSAAAAQKMEALGFKEIYDLQGGYLAWPPR